MRAELEEPGASIGKAALPLVRKMHEIEEDAWYGIFGTVEEPTGVIVAAIGEEALALMEWLRSRGGLENPPMPCSLEPDGKAPT